MFLQALGGLSIHVRQLKRSRNYFCSFRAGFSSILICADTQHIRDRCCSKRNLQVPCIKTSYPHQLVCGLCKESHCAMAYLNKVATTFGTFDHQQVDEEEQIFPFGDRISTFDCGSSRVAETQACCTHTQQDHIWLNTNLGFDVEWNKVQNPYAIKFSRCPRRRGAKPTDEITATVHEKCSITNA